ncbi:MAG: NADP-dependent phosphogluconate dehydrogenase [Deltaproteobacteria bacterium]|nr:NADP-dependent phosphogluconate dehydrogenase [Deltaproteobacteria bacterium]
MKSDIGLIGLGVMGENLALNIESRGYSVSVYNRTPSVTDEFKQTKAPGKKFIFSYSLKQLVKSIQKPRKIIMMVSAGLPVDLVIGSLIPLLNKGDVLIDGGNSLYTDTERREAALKKRKLNYIGIGVSGGEKGARFGPALMPGGTREGYDYVAGIFEKIAAESDSGKCVTYVGPGGAGHYVKMVHNGIEYGDMQLIAETYDIMKNSLKLTNKEMADIFEAWNKDILSSYLIEITYKILRKRDKETDNDLIDMILDKAGQKGTGAWTVAASLEYGIPVPTISSAVIARGMSYRNDLRYNTLRILGDPAIDIIKEDKSKIITMLHNALYAAKIISYSQGFDLISSVSDLKKWNINKCEVARIWKGGCIIRARFLNEIMNVYTEEPGIPHLLLSKKFSKDIINYEENLKNVVLMGMKSNVPLFAYSSAFNYLTSLRKKRLPHNLTQAQRDFFGAHTYKRTDREGDFHTEWEDE